MFDSDSPFPQAIPALADCYEAAAAGTFPYVIYFGRRHGDCCAIAILFRQAGAIPRLPLRNLYFGRRDTPIAAPRFLKRPARYPDRRAAILCWPARYLDCRAAIFLLAGAIPSNAAPQSIFWPSRYLECRAATYLFAGAIPSNAAPQSIFWPARFPRMPRLNLCFGGLIT